MDFGQKPAGSVDNPIIEPAWGGPRVLIHVAGRAVEARDDQGALIPLRDDVVDALTASLDATGTTTALLDGYLSSVPTRGTVGVSVGFEVVDRVKPADMRRQLLFGGGGRNRRRERIEADLARHAHVPTEGPYAFVAIDLLWVDDEPLVDVPLLERKRLLEAVSIESDLVRLSPHVRPPVEPWYGQWRAFGFHEMAVRNANSRYRPGERSDDWALAMIPRR